MKELAQWFNWRYEERDSQVTKVPVCPHTGGLAAVDRPETWGTYDEAVRAAQDHEHDGVGFVFTEEDPYAGVDIDECRDPETGEIEAWAQEIIEELNSYTEISPSGIGVHILVRALTRHPVEEVLPLDRELKVIDSYCTKHEHEGKLKRYSR